MSGPPFPAPFGSGALSRTTATRWNSRGFLLIPLLLLAVLATRGPVEAASPPAAHGRSGMVSSVDDDATRVGVEILRAGGNAVDAGVAVAFALTVTYPIAAPVGGGGFLLYRDEHGEHFALDFRETAPGDLRAEQFLDEDGRPRPGSSLDGGLAVGVPGTVRGLADAHARWGALPWKDLLAPAIRLAESGFEVNGWLADRLESRRQKLGRRTETARIFTREEPWSAGARLRQPDLAATLRRIAEHGPAGFYEGPIAGAISRSVRDEGGVLSERDLQAYESAWREPIEGRYRDYRIVCFPPPSSGGVVLLQILAMLERFDLRSSGPGSSLTVHRMAEAERRAYADRSRWLGDPGFADVPLAGLLDAEYLTTRSASIRDRRSTPSRRISPGVPPGADDGETLHFSVGDSSGRAVSLTLTLNRLFGNGMVAEGTGILLNNEIDDFSLAPGIPNSYGLLGGAANSVAAGKRPLSSMTPTIVEHVEGSDFPALVLGSPGGSTIITSVLQVLINFVDHEMALQEAVNAARFHHQWYPDRIRHERLAFPEDVRRSLEKKGHELEALPLPLGNVNAIAGIDGAWSGAADPRRHGAAAGY